jgi:hypothetical protein
MRRKTVDAYYTDRKPDELRCAKLHRKFLSALQRYYWVRWKIMFYFNWLDIRTVRYQALKEDRM